MANANSNRSTSLVAAVSYSRMSSDKQTESPDQQRKAIAEYAEQHGYQIVEEFFDHAISGDATDRLNVSTPSTVNAAPVFAEPAVNKTGR